MKACLSLVVLAAAAITAACSTPERSRNLGDPAISGRVIAVQVCAMCHGADGNSESPNFPRLAAQQEAYFIEQMNGFKSHNRADPAGFEYMWGLSRQLTEAQIKDLAAYFAAQKPALQKETKVAMNVEGKKIFESGIADKSVAPCSSCHGPAGAGNAGFPRIAGQHADYLVKQLQVYQRTDQRPEGAVMKQVAHALTPQDMAAVSAYAQSLP